MKPTEFCKSMKDYLYDAYIKKKPDLPEEGIHADLHVHPYITDKESLDHTLEMMYENDLDLLAITTHGKGDEYEYDFWKVKEIAKKELIIDDKERLFTIKYNDKELNFVPAYEIYVKLDGIKGRIDMVSLMPEQGFEEDIGLGLDFKDYQKINDEYDAILIGAHPYTIWDPWPLPFRLAKKEERKIIEEKLFPEVDAVDLVSTNSLWMHISNDHIKKDYGGYALTNSDVHGKNKFARKKIGCSRDIFDNLNFNSGNELKEDLLEKIHLKKFKNYEDYLGIGQFIVQLCLGKKPLGFP